MIKWIVGLMAPALLLLATGTLSAQEKQPPETIGVDQIPRVYGIHVVKPNQQTLRLATPMGLYQAEPAGEARLLSGVKGHVMAVTVHPRNPQWIYAGGHLDQKTSLGLMATRDGGKNWKQVAPNAAETDGFHILSISPANPKTLYGVSSDLRVSEDGGKTWKSIGPQPTGLIHFSASARSAKTIYAATRTGLMISRDQGKNWKTLKLPGEISTLAHITPKGKIFTFMVGQGLMVADESKLNFKLVSNNFSIHIPIRLAIDPGNPDRMYAATTTGGLITSGDGGKNWHGYEGMHRNDPGRIAKGKKLFDTYCQTCHGPNGTGQQNVPGFDPSNPPKIQAPALDESAHAWHHSDKALLSTILNGSTLKDSPMIAWKKVLSEDDAESILAWMKSTWTVKTLACQGARHMACMRHN